MEPRIIIHSLAHARAALAAAAELGQSVTVMSAPRAAAYLGAALFREMAATAARDFPGVAVTALLDCGDDAGLALNALRHGIKAVRVAVPEPVQARIADIAGQMGAAVDPESAVPALDLFGVADAAAACRQWLRRAAA